MFNYKRLLSDSVIFAIGNLGSKLINFFLIPLYTHYLTTTEYGTIDLVTTLVSMLLPIISLNIFEAILRYGMDKSKDNKIVFTNGIFVTILGCIIGLVLYPIFSHFGFLGDLLIYFYVIIYLQAFELLFAQFIRSIRKTAIYSINGILIVLTTGSFSIFLIVKMKMGVEGYFCATIIGLLISLMYLLFSSKLYRYIDFSGISLLNIKEMLLYSIPLIPNMINLWITRSSSRYFILMFIGASANGLFAVAYKIPSILTMINSVFFQAWQLAAIEEFESKNKSSIYSDVFKNFSTLMFLGVSSLLIVLKPMMQIFVANEYYISWECIPFLLLGTIFSSFSSFLGTNYTAAKKTNGVFKTTIYGAMSNIILNAILIPLMGINGASLSYMISYLIVWILRISDTKQFIKIEFDTKKLILQIALLILQILSLYLVTNSIANIISQIIVFFSLAICNKYFLNKIYFFVKREIKH